MCNAYANEMHKKIPQVYSLRKTEASFSTQTENNLESTVENCEKETSCLNFIQPDFYQASFLISNFAEEEFSEEDDNVNDVEVAKSFSCKNLFCEY